LIIKGSLVLANQFDGTIGGESNYDLRMTTATELERASNLLSEGKFLETAALCGAILHREPRNAIAAHLLGLALKDSGDWNEGTRWLRFSIELEPRRAEFHANLANLLRRRGRYVRAAEAYQRALALAPNHRPARHNLALTLNDLNRFDEAEAQCRLLIADDASDADTWALLGLTLTGQNRLSEAEAAYRQAIELDPQNQVAHHNLGALMSRMDKPEAALDALARARTLGADGFELAFNQGRAYLDINEIDLAEREFERAAALRPDHLDAQFNLARVRYMRGDRQFARSLAAASVADRDNLELQLTLGQLLWRSGNLVGAETLMHDLLKRHDANPRVQSALAGILLEQGMLREAEAQAVEAATTAPNDAEVIETLVTIMLARGCAADAVPFIDVQRRKNPDSQAWIAYEATAARALGNDRYHELYDYERVVRSFEVEPPAGWSSMAELNQALLTVLSDRHRFKNRPLDQTLRHGTQTARSLLTDPDPAIQAILKAFDAPIAQYRDTLRTDPGHPLSARNLGAAQFTGAWSVRLRRQGFHVNHFHPDGWLSSAYYVDVPPETQSSTLKSGWIKFGEPRYPTPGMAAERFVQPRPGLLVLFPSYMWHGTNPIHGDDPRLTIAFDVKPGGQRAG
jgi:Flp pilus assembly protein TadD